MTTPVRVLLAKPTHDCHDRGVRFVARRFRDAGFEVIFSNFLLPEEVIGTALEEDVDVIGVSSSSGGHMPVFESLVEGVRENGLTGVMLLGGGVIPPEDTATLKAMGVSAVFGPGTSAEDAIELIQRHMTEKIAEQMAEQGGTA